MTDATARPSAARGRPRGEYAKSEVTRKAILNAALEVFAVSGYRSGSLREVAQRVGMSEAGLLHHFRNKGALLQAVLDHRDDLARHLVPTDHPDGAETLRGLVKLAEYNAGEPGVVELYCTLSAEATSERHPAHTYFIRRYQWTREMITIAFRKIAADGRLHPSVDPERAAVMTVALMDGLQVQWLLDRDLVDMAEEIADFLRSIISGFDLEALEAALDEAGRVEGHA